VASDYILGTHDEELKRLRFQHDLWLPAARAAWQRAGLKPGMRVLDWALVRALPPWIWPGSWAPADGFLGSN
jgi:hypothetical protein